MSRQKKTPKTGMLRTLRARAQSVTMHVTEEDDWDTDVPNVRFARIIAVVGLLHVIAAGGILIFHQIGKKENKADRVVAATPKAQRTAVLSSTELAPEDSRAPKFGDPSVRGLKQWRVASGDNLVSIARRFNVSVKGIEEVNRLGAGASIFPGLILYIPNKTITAATSDDVKNIIDKQSRGRVAANNYPKGNLVPVAMNPAVLEVDAPRALPVAPPVVPPQVAPEPTPRPVAPAPPAQPTIAQKNKVRAVVQSYTIKKGDTAYSLGRRFGISHTKLLQINGIADARTLRVGQAIRVPMKAE